MSDKIALSLISLFLSQSIELRKLVPRLIIGQQKQFMIIADGVIDQVSHAALRPTFGKHLHQILRVLRNVLRKHRVNRLFSQLTVGVFINNAPSGRQAQFQCQAASHLLKETVERTDAQAMQMPRYICKQRKRCFARDFGRRKKLAQPFRSLRIFGRFRKAQQNASKNFSGGFTRECCGKNCFGTVAKE